MRGRDDAPLELRIERVLAGEADEAEIARVAEWRRASPANEAEYRRYERLTDAARSLRGIDISSPPPPTAAEIIARAGWRRARGGARGRTLGRAAVGLAAAAAIVLLLVARGGADATGWSPTEVTTGSAERATLTLPDGTVVRLAPSSRLRVERGRVREVRLDGRAFFAVAHRTDQPFRVHTPEGTVRVLGTRFELVTGEASLRLRVIEGRVAVEAARNAVEVAAGQQTEVREGAAAEPSRLAGPTDDPAFGRFLAFQATPLSTAAVEIERLYGVSVRVDTALAATTVTATFTDRTVDEVIGVLCEVLGGRCTVDGDRVEVLQ